MLLNDITTSRTTFQHLDRKPQKKPFNGGSSRFAVFIFHYHLLAPSTSAEHTARISCRPSSARSLVFHSLSTSFYCVHGSQSGDGSQVTVKVKKFGVVIWAINKVQVEKHQINL